ncbi:GDP-mannose 4,6-dehydratase [Catenovulum sp. 2E275]|uniref:GDP-mannose 4,6-dehydratase n=1 Tax=Catenovulum sp. 2E275 TaxID=2980497 RepID=UPI0021D1C239|nr:GDP-mannose 4,6-dehydratase [Catenovulum sp. 2E275]MCU4674737.1 GDP-mannose 4,6-dehydratase [Catenovulum sp. 2E275]
MRAAKTVFVLGANSFAGGCFVAHMLQHGYKVVGINRSDEKTPEFVPYKLANLGQYYQFYPYDINVHYSEICQLIEQCSPQYIVDFAGQGMVAESWQNPHQWYQTNVVAKSKLINFLKDKHFLEKYVRVSTPEVYGSTEQLISESSNYNPSTPYAISHATIDMHLMAYHKQFDFPAILTRFSNFYGPTQQLYRIIPRTMIYAKLGKKLSLHGGGRAIRAFIYGDDAANGLRLTLEKGEIGQSYHFSTDEFVSIRDLVEQINQVQGVNFDEFVQISEDRLGKDLQYLMNDSKARTELSWQPQVNLRLGLLYTLDWIESHWDVIQTQPLNYIHKV